MSEQAKGEAFVTLREMGRLLTLVTCQNRHAPQLPSTETIIPVFSNFLPAQDLAFQGRNITAKN